MKLGDFPIVEALIATRNDLIAQRDEGRIRIEIDNRKLEADFVDEVTPAIKLAIRHRIEDIDTQLRHYGVVIA